MRKFLFYKYDYFQLAEKLRAQDVIDVLGNDETLVKLVEQFMSLIIDTLYRQIMSDEKIDVNSIDITNEKEINTRLCTILIDNNHYKAYIIASSKKDLFQRAMEKFLGRLFANDRINDEEFEIQRDIHSWLETMLALEILQDKRFSTVDVIVKVIESTELLDTFYFSLLKYIPPDWIKDNIDDLLKVNINPDNVVENYNMRDKSFFKNYEKRFPPSATISSWQYVKQLDEYANFMTLNNRYSFISSILLHTDVSSWVRLLDNLKLPVIQDCAFHGIMCPDQYVDIINMLVSQKDTLKSNFTYLVLIVLKHFFETSIRLTERLAIYDDEERIQYQDRKFSDEGKRYKETWENDKIEYYKRKFFMLNGNIARSDIEELIFSYKKN
jgi:hypothetical protein